MKKVSIIDVTDLYHFHQDKGDNIDLIVPYAMDEIDLKAVILDCTNHFRQPTNWDATGVFYDDGGPRDPGIIPVNQLNAIFDETVPYGTTPFHPMKSPDDKLLDAPKYQQQGIDLILRTLKEADEKIDILIFGSLRSVAAAYNREPALLAEKVNRIHISAGSTSSDFLEWNINLDNQAAVCLYKSKLPIYIYPCAGDIGPFDLSQYNSYWSLENMAFIKDMVWPLKSYLQYALTKAQRTDFLRAIEEEADDAVLGRFYKEQHGVWETALWLEVSDRRLVQKASGEYLIVKPEEITIDDRIIHTEMRNCTLSVKDNGGFDYTLTNDESNFKIFYRENPEEYQTALNEAFPKWYHSFHV